MMIIALPLLAAGMLGVFALLLKPLRVLPQHEYDQLVRVPAWFVVVIGFGISLLSCVACAQVSAGALQLFVGGGRDSAPLLMVDMYALWGSMLLGLVMAVSGWVPAARRSLAHRALPYCVMLLMACWLALLMLFSISLAISLICWLLLLGLVLCMWAMMFRPDWRWVQIEILVLLALAAVCGVFGLLLLRTLIHHAELSGMWSILLTAPPRVTHSALLLIILGWLGPAVYLPWSVWQRQEEKAMVWIPGVLLLTCASVLALIRLLFFALPPGGEAIAIQMPGSEYLLLIALLLRWMLAWGFLALLLGAAWLAYLVVRKRQNQAYVLRPLTIVVAGLLLSGIAGSMLGQIGPFPLDRANALNGVFWIVPLWIGSITTWLAGKNLLPTLAVEERVERRAILVALWMMLAMLAAFPLTAGFQALRALWSPWKLYGFRPELLLMLLLLSVVSFVLLLLPWSREHVAPVARVGAGWGSIGPLFFALVLLVYGIFAMPHSPLLLLLRQSLLQTY